MEYRRYEGINDLEFNADGDVRWYGSKQPYEVAFPNKWDGGRVKIYPNGYDGGFKQFSIYKIIATLFVPNPDGHKFVKCIDGDKRNWTASNLRWSHCSLTLKCDK